MGTNCSELSMETESSRKDPMILHCSWRVASWILSILLSSTSSITISMRSSLHSLVRSSRMESALLESYCPLLKENYEDYYRVWGRPRGWIEDFELYRLEGWLSCLSMLRITCINFNTFIVKFISPTANYNPSRYFIIQPLCIFTYIYIECTCPSP